MKYIMFPYFVGCMYEGGATEYLKVKTSDPDKFVIELIDKLEKFASVLNDRTIPHPDLIIEGVKVPYEAFLHYDGKKEKWICEDPNMEEYLFDDVFVVELRGHGYGHYHFLKANSKEELIASFEKAYSIFVSGETKEDKINIAGEKFSKHDLVYDETRYDQKGRKLADLQYPNFECVYTREEWFSEK